MDAWSADQLKKMQAGGNAKMNAFFQQYGIEKNTDIIQKYNSQAAEFYREKLKAEIAGTPYNPPPPSSVPKPAARAGGMKSAKSGKKDEWDDWGDESSSRNGGGAGISGKAGNEYTMAQYEASASKKDDYFSRKMQENASKPEGLPPSQGGKYVGFGSAPPPRAASSRQGDDIVATLSTGISSLSVLAQSAATNASFAVRSGSQSMSRAINDGHVAENLTKSASVVTERAAAAASAGWLGLKSLYAGVASTVENAAKSQGYQIDLGAKAVAGSVQQQGPVNRAQSGSRAYGGDDGVDGYGSVSNQEPSYDDDYGSGGRTAGNDHGHSGTGGGGQSGMGGHSASAGNFSGFDGGDDGWNNDDDGWGSKKTTTATTNAKKTISARKGATATAAHKSKSTPAFKDEEEEDGEWGKW